MGVKYCREDLKNSTGSLASVKFATFSEVSTIPKCIRMSFKETEKETGEVKLFLTHQVLGFGRHSNELLSRIRIGFGENTKDE